MLYFKSLQIGNDEEAKFQNVIVLHGVGSDENSLIAFVKNVNVPGHYFFLRGPLALGPGRNAWFEVQFTTHGPVHNQDQAEDSLSLLKNWIDENKKSGVLKDKSKLVFMGFSQGAIMSYAFSFRYPDSVDKVIGLNGRVLKEVEALKPNLDCKKIMINSLYGLQDQVQPIHFGHEAKLRFEKTWIILNYKEINVGHEINHETLVFTKEALSLNLISS
jgi:phospholipase/carboxylesterase